MKDVASLILDTSFLIALDLIFVIVVDIFIICYCDVSVRQPQHVKCGLAFKFVNSCLMCTNDNTYNYKKWHFW